MIQETEISKEDLFRKIDTLKIKCFDKEDALKSAETRIQELIKCNDYANEEIERLHSIIKEVREYIEKYEAIIGYYDSNYDGEYDTYTHDFVKEDVLKILNKENKNE